MSSTPQVPPIGAHGRGARSNATGRYESLTREAFDDGWTELDEPPKKLRTVLHLERARKIISTNDSPDIGFDQSINPYRGCEHGWLYTPVSHTPLAAARSGFFHSADASHLRLQRHTEAGKVVLLGSGAVAVQMCGMR